MCFSINGVARHASGGGVGRMTVPCTCTCIPLSFQEVYIRIDNFFYDESNKEVRVSIYTLNNTYCFCSGYKKLIDMKQNGQFLYFSGYTVGCIDSNKDKLTCWSQRSILAPTPSVTDM